MVCCLIAFFESNLWVWYHPRKALESLSQKDPIIVTESLPFGSDNLDTMVIADDALDQAANRVAEMDLDERVNMEGGEPPATLL